MRGDTVILRVFGGGATLARVWEVFPETICILSPDRFLDYKQGVSDYWPVGFPKDDVFKCDEAATYMLQAGQIAWGKLAHYEGDI
jgi:hypothetical protein